MLRELLRFEIRYHLRQPLFALAGGVLALIGLLVMSSELGVALGDAPGNVPRNAPAVILQLMAALSALGLFVVTAFVASAAQRDFELRTDMLFFTHPISKRDYLFGRFGGAMIVSLLLFVLVAVGMAVAHEMPWQAHDRIGPFRLAPFLFGLGVVVLPNLLVMGAIFFAVAIWTRRLAATYVCVVLFLGLQDGLEVVGSRLESPLLGSLLEPLGLVAMKTVTRYWTVADYGALPAAGGVLLANRLVWLGVGLLAFVVAYRRFRFTERAHARPVAPDDGAPAAATLAAPSPRPLRVRRAFSPGTAWRQLGRQTRLEVSGVARSGPFVVILCFALLFIVTAAWLTGHDRGTSIVPVTQMMLRVIENSMTLVLAIVVVLYAGELVWRDRALGFDGIRDSLPTPDSIQLGAKLLALAFVVVVFVTVSIAATVAVQLARGHADLEPGLYARGFLVIAAPFLLLSVPALLFQLLASNRFTGTLLMIVFLAVRVALPALGLEQNLAIYGGHPRVLYSDMNGYGHFAAPFVWFHVYWGCAAALLLVACLKLWPRGAERSLRRRVAAACARSSRPTRVFTSVAAAGFAASFGWIFFNTNVVNEDLTAADVRRRLATYEERYGEYRDAALPRITDVRVEVDIFPSERRLSVEGRYVLENRGDAPLRTLPVTISPRHVEGFSVFPRGARLERVDLPPHVVTVADHERGFHVYELEDALAPGTTMEFGFEVSVENPGFVNARSNDQVVENGTFLTSRNVMPVLGYAEENQLQSPKWRGRLGLPPLERMADLDDAAACERNYLGADWIDFEAVVSTREDQIALVPGELVREWREGGRRFFHYETRVPIVNLFAILSADYEVRRDEWNGVDVEVYHHATHGRNVGRMIDIAKRSLEIFSAAFGPYPHRALRIAEIPNTNGQLAMSVANLIPFSESFGFLYDPDRGQMDMTAYVTAHEVAHQWWNHVLVPADVRGATFIAETLSQYAALMVMEREFGAAEVRHYLGYELDQYLDRRGSERLAERPLLHVESSQGYVHYQKGSLAMIALRDAIGEEALNRALRRFLEAYAFGGPPYPTARALLAEIRREVPGEHDRLLEDLFEKITLFDTRVSRATCRARADGTWAVTLEATVRKLRADGQGEETEVPVDDWLDVAVFGRAGTLLFERRRVTTNDVRFELIVDERPTRAGVDPYHKWIDRDVDDNVKTVTVERSP